MIESTQASTCVFINKDKQRSSGSLGDDMLGLVDVVGVDKKPQGAVDDRRKEGSKPKVVRKRPPPTLSNKIEFLGSRPTRYI